MIERTFEKYADEGYNYTFDFTANRIVLDADAAVSVTVTGSPSGLTIGSPTISGYKVTVNISGGTAGITYTLTCTVTRASGLKNMCKGYLVVV